MSAGQAVRFTRRPNGPDFSSIGGVKHCVPLVSFAIMFEALFILTTIDAGTRLADLFCRKLWEKYSNLLAEPIGYLKLSYGGLFVFGWAYFIYSGSVSTIWPMFGAANQLLATVALAIGTSFIINRGKAKYAWITVVPMVFVGITTLPPVFKTY